MKFAIAGSGAMGCRFAYQLKEAGQDIVMIDTWPAHVEVIREKGLLVHLDEGTKRVHIPIYYPTELTESVDVVIVFTKAMQLGSMLESIQPAFGPQTQVVCLLNGLGHELVMKQYVNVENIIMGTTIWSSVLDGPGEVSLHGTGALSLQNFYDAPESKQRVIAVVESLDAAGLNASYSADVLPAIWKKACTNACGNAASALLECNLAGVFDTPYTEGYVRAITTEFAQVAATQGVALDVESVVQSVIEVSMKIKEHHASMYQDLIMNHRLTEVDYINGAVSKLGRVHGIPTPTNDVIVNLVHMKEQLLNAK